MENSLTKLFLKHSFFYTISNVFIRGINFFLLPLYTRLLTPRDYGIVDLITISSNLVNYLVTLEITQAVARFFPEMNEDEKKTYSFTSVIFVISTYSVFVFFALAFKNDIKNIFFDSSITDDLYYLSISYFSVNGIFILLQSQLRWGLQVKECNFVNSIVAAITIFFTCLFVIYLKMGPNGVILGFILGNFVGIILSFYFLRNVLKVDYSIYILKKMLYFSLPLVPSSIGAFLSIYVDRIFIKEILSIHELGIYGIAYRFAAIANIIMIGLQSAVTPLIYNNYKKKEAAKEIAKSFYYICFVLLIIFQMMFIWIKEILLVFTTATYYDAWTSVLILTPALGISGLYVFAPGLGIAKKTKFIATISIFSCAINIILNYFLIPIYSINGAAIATLISMLFSTGAFFYLGNKFYYIPYDWKPIFYSITMVVLSGLICNLTNPGIIFKILETIVCVCIIIKIMMGKFSSRILNVYRR